MPCLQTAGLASGSACPPPKTGLVEGQIWLGNWSEITFTGGTNKLYTDITMASTKVLFRVNVHNKGLDLTDTFEENETTGARKWPTRMPFRILDRSAAAAAFVEGLGTELVAFIVSKSGKVFVAGSDAPLRLVENTAGFGDENFGESVVLGNDEGSKPYQLLDTDLATTIATLVAAQTP
jgi:hypothetical protein